MSEYIAARHRAVGRPAGRRLAATWVLGLGAAVATLATLTPLTTSAQSYPTRTVRLLVGFPPGGGTDVVAREVGNELAKALGQQVIVDNRGGANGVIATTELAKAAPDGHTLMMTISSHVTNALLYPKLPYTLDDFQPISRVSISPFVLIAHPSFKPATIAELIESARKDQLDFGSPGPGSTQHLSMELMNSMAGVRMTHIPYRGGAPALTDLLAGQVPMMFMTTVQSLPFLKDGRVKALGVSSGKRTAVLPDVPTIAEAGVPGYESDVWFGVIAPKGTPAPVVDRLHTEIKRIVALPQIRKSFAAQGVEPVGDSPREFAAVIEAERVKWGDLIQRNNIRAE